MMKSYLILLLLLAFTATTWAVKMHPGISKIKQSDGTELRVKAFGDEDFCYFTTTDGVLLYQEGTDFYVATVDNSGMARSTGVLAHEPNLRNGNEAKLIAKQDVKLFNSSMAANAAKARMKREPMEPNGTLLRSTGSPKVLVILVDFSDEKFTVKNPKDVFYKYLNATELFNSKTDKDMGSNYGSVKRYFTDMSYGAFTPNFDVYGPVTLPEPLKHYGAGYAASENMYDLFKDACRAIDGNGDFVQYDSNNDGMIDLVYIIYAGYSQSFTGNSTDCIHPKSGTLNHGITLGGKTVCRYGVNNELNGTPKDQEKYGLLINGIGLFCHEFSHCMGLPDMYPASGTVAERCINQNLDYWDLMDAGEYTYNGYCPTEYTSWERERLGWMAIDTLASATNVTLETLANKGKAYRILNDKDYTGNEYYIVENVQRTGWNRYLPGSGMLVFHVDYDDYQFSLGGCKVNNTAGHPRMTIMSADGMFVPEYYTYTTITAGTTDIERTTNQPLIDKYGGMEMTYDMYQSELAGDPFPGTTGVTAFTDTTTPASWVYAGDYMGKPITDITENSDTKTVSFKFMGGVDTGISNINADQSPSHIYSIDGRPLGTDISALSKGLYIINKKKVIIR